MEREIASFARRLRGDESGAVFILVAIGIVAFLGLGALAIDVGRIVYAQRALQAATDMAAQSGAAVIYSNITATNVATQYSATSGNYNVQKGVNATMPSGYPKLISVNGTASGGCPTNKTLAQYQYPDCVASGPNSGCAAISPYPVGCNAIVVKQTATVSLILGEIFKMGPVTVSASSLAVRGGAFPPLNIMIVLDNTQSMSNTHETGATDCGISNPTKLDCALAGVQILLSELWPSRDQVGLMVFPPVQSSTAGNDADCSASTQITPEPYNSTTATYQIPVGTSNCSSCGMATNYKTSNTTTSLNLPSTYPSLTAAACQSNMTSTNLAGSTVMTCSSCAGLYAPGGQGTYFAGAINAAQKALVASNDQGICATQICQNVIIILSDGGAGNGGTLATLSASGAALAGSTTLSFASVPSAVIPGTSVADVTNPDKGAISATTSVVSVNNTTPPTVTLSAPVTGTGVKSGDTITFGSNNQCNEAIIAAQNAAKAGTWVYSIAYGSGLGDSQADTVANISDFSSCSDTETPQVNSCYTMEQIASSPGAIPNLTKFYSDPMAGGPTPNSSQYCVSPDHPTATDIPTIFEDIANGFTFTSLVACNAQQAGGSC
ncbi:MAG: pilus assembly protein TadG-related protein [Xanthobacteraceae bacterium]